MSPGPVRWRIWSPRFARPCGKACKRPGVAVLKSGLHSGWKNKEILRSTMKSQWICNCLRFDNLLHVWRGGPQPWERWRTWCVHLTTVNECQNHGVTKQNIALSNIYPSTALGYDSAGGLTWPGWFSAPAPEKISGVPCRIIPVTDRVKKPPNWGSLSSSSLG